MLKTTKNNEPLISLVVPIYNVKDYLKRCIVSLINQSYKKLEIILVDDGSTDGSSELCEVLAKGDKRIKVIHKINGGLSDARNTGIVNSTGEYISFIDSDDWLSKDSIKILFNNLRDNNTDISSGKMIRVFNDNINQFQTIEEKCQVFNKEEALENMMYLHEITNSACAKMYKREIFNKIRYPKGKLYEDLGTTYKVISECKKISVTNQIIYYYYQNSNSIMHYKYNSKRLQALEFAKEELEFIEKKYPNIKNAAIFRLYIECIYILGDMPLFCEDSAIVKKYIKKYRKTVLRDRKLYGKQKLLCLSTYLGHFGVKIAYLIKKIRENAIKQKGI